MSVLPRPPDGDLAGLPPSVLAYLAALEALVVAHEARIVALEARLRQDSSTSSRPPSSDPPGTPAWRAAGASGPSSGAARRGTSGPAGGRRAGCLSGLRDGAAIRAGRRRPGR